MEKSIVKHSGWCENDGRGVYPSVVLGGYFGSCCITSLRKGKGVFCIKQTVGSHTLKTTV